MAISVVCKAGKGVGVVVEGVEVAEPGDFLFSVWDYKARVFQAMESLVMCCCEP